MKTEISAGGVIVRRGKRGSHVLLLQDMNESWTFPKGMVENGETNEHAAIREIAEEVGLYTLRLIASLQSITYFYKKNSRIKKTVHYFLFEYTGIERPVGQKSEGIRAVKWFSFQKATQSIGYRQTNLPLLQKAKILV